MNCKRFVFSFCWVKVGALHSESFSFYKTLLKPDVTFNSWIFILVILVWGTDLSKLFRCLLSILNILGLFPTYLKFIKQSSDFGSNQSRLFCWSSGRCWDLSFMTLFKSEFSYFTYMFLHYLLVDKSMFSGSKNSST